MQDFKAWEARLRRYLWYQGVLAARMRAWPRERINACEDTNVLNGLVKLGERAQRHEQRIKRNRERFDQAVKLMLANVRPESDARN